VILRSFTDKKENSVAIRRGQKGVVAALVLGLGILTLLAVFNLIDGLTFAPTNPILRSCARFVAEGGEWSQPKPCR